MSETGSQGSSNTNPPNGERIESDPPLFVQKRVGRYDIIYPIAVGGMATVHVGRLSGMAGFERLVAVKTIHPHLAQEQSFVEMFLDEARHAAGIHHQNVGEIYEVGEDAGLYYMIGELVLGQDLNRLLSRASKKQTLIERTLCAYIIARVGRGLHEAHNLISPEGEPINLVHRDISPRNIVISYKGDVKVIDFGVAWARGRLAHTEAGSVKGKVGFIPPEHIRGEPLDRRSDIFCLGIVLYLLVTRVHPFPGRSDAERLTKILTGRMDAPRSIEPKIDEELEHVVMKAMAPKREERYQTAAEMAKDLDSYVRHRGLSECAELISKMMVDFFKPEIKSHHEKIKKYRKLHNEGTDSYTPTDTTSRILAKEKLPRGSGASEENLRDTDMVDPRPYISKARSIPSRWERLTQLSIQKWLAAIGVVLVIVVLAFVFATSGEEPVGMAGESQTQQGEVGAPAEFIILSLRISEPEATVSWDGKIQKKGMSELTLPADRKEHSLMVEKKGYFTYYKTIKADKGKSVIINLKPLPSSEIVGDAEPRGSQVGDAKSPEVRPSKRKKTLKKPSRIFRKRSTRTKTKNDRPSSSGSPALERSPYR